MYDLLIKGGEVFDPGSGMREKLDVAVADGKIASLDGDIHPSTSLETFNAAGKVVTPGLIDFHTHVFPYFTPWGVEADKVATGSGVTTFVDTGSAGALTFAAFRKFIIEPAASRIFAFLNISAIGLLGVNDDETGYIDNCSIEKAVETAETY